mgnify:CR=1 FL=1
MPIVLFGDMSEEYSGEGEGLSFGDWHTGVISSFVNLIYKRAEVLFSCTMHVNGCSGVSGGFHFNAIFGFRHKIVWINTGSDKIWMPVWRNCRIPARRPSCLP